MILTDAQIRAAVKSGEIKIVPFEDKQVRPASYDLRIGDSGATTSTKKLTNIKEAGYLLLQPGDFAIVTILEEIQLDASHVGRFGLRSKYARKGIIATTGPQIDPGYHGRLRIGLTNLTPHAVTLSHGDDIISAELHKLSQPCEKPYSGPYQGQMQLGPEEIEAAVEGSGMAISEVITTLGSLSQNVGSLTNDVRALTHQVKTNGWIVGIGIAFIAPLVAVATLRPVAQASAPIYQAAPRNRTRVQVNSKSYGSLHRPHPKVDWPGRTGTVELA